MLSAVAPVEKQVITGVESVSPEAAFEALRTMGVNRQVKEASVAKFADAMRRGQWTLSQPLIFDTRGRLIDGQHRLRAVVKSGRPQSFVVIRGLPSEAMFHIDIGKSRSASDILKMQGEKNVASLAAVARVVLAMERGVSDPGRAAYLDPPPSVDDLVLRAADQRLKDVTDLAMSRYRPLTRMVRSTAFTGWFLYCATAGLFENKHLFEDFTSVALGKHAGAHDGDPAHVLRTRLLRQEGTTTTTPAHIRLALVIKAWNAFVESGHVTSLSYRSVGRNAERFPLMKLDRRVAAAGYR